MRRYLRLGLFLLPGIAAIYLFFQGSLSLRILEEASERFSLVIQERIAPGRAREILSLEADSEEPLLPAFWGEIEGVQAENPDLSRRATLRLIQVVGNAQLLFPEGTGLADGDKQGCLVAKNTAKDLFGSSRPIGKRILYESKSYEIRGILESEKDVLVIQAEGGDEKEILLDTVTARDQTRSAEEIKSLLQNKYGISGTAEEWDLVYGLSKGILLLLPLAAGITLLGCIRGYGKRAVQKKEKRFWQLSFYGACLGFLVLAAGQIQIPEWMVPTRWSDFDFWAALWEQKTQALDFLANMEKRVPELPFVEAFFHTVASGILALTLYFLSIICYTQSGK